ncbi:hypothetical protein P171DRAFT_466903 [Karstenula rhodostoma CBS 690.94]|uniref:NAD(P)-binding domain-containing protein n=1 Tax=Karstenula rhodostoma CBS 690.94 TaxID=1392251 RepID=A0A9P4P6H5_9PLEO|nr:hypothetical protein P171DRAFT_466903 [Karstenula rhodostoma CBS 690.94]
MVPLPHVLVSNASISTTLPAGLVAVFAGAMTGIGLATLKTFVKYSIAPRIYLFARNPHAVGEVVEMFVKVDLSSLRETDAACDVVKSKEDGVNLVVLSMKEVRLDRTLTPEGLHLFLATVYYARMRIVQALLPALIHASAYSRLARVVDIAGGTKEGPVDMLDLAALRVPFAKICGQLASMHTLSLKTLAEQVLGVSFVHDFPGAEVTPLFDGGACWAGWGMWVLRLYLRVFRRWVCVSVEECGKRYVFLGTSAKYAAGEGEAGGVLVGEGVERRTATEGVRGCVYSGDWDVEGPGGRVMGLLKGLGREGIKEVVWEHTNGEFERIRRGEGL